jgi:hypothetical protein
MFAKASVLRVTKTIDASNPSRSSRWSLIMAERGTFGQSGRPSADRNSWRRSLFSRSSIHSISTAPAP